MKRVILVAALFLSAYLVGEFVFDWRGVINAVIADERSSVDGWKSCNRRLSEIEVNGVDFARIRSKAGLLYKVDPYLTMPDNSSLAINISIEKRVYRLYFDDFARSGKRLNIQVTEGESVGNVTKVCFVPDRIIKSEVGGILKNLEVNLKPGQKLDVIYGYGISGLGKMF